jgi:hypothetical protein
MTARLSLSLLILLGLAAPLPAAPDPAAEAISPGSKVIQLFNGRDLSGFYTWMRDTQYEDPRHVFTVHDGLLHISGDGYGAAITRQAYKDYRLIAEFRWGTRTWGKRKDRAKDSGILVHCVGPDGNSGAWMASIETQIIEGGVGDFIVVGGKYSDGTPVPVSLTCELRTDGQGNVFKDAMGVYWKKGGRREALHRGRINWFGRDPGWKDVLGFRGKDDVESPDGQWTRMEVICDGGQIRTLVNGVVVNEGSQAFPSAGKILFQTEMAEIFFRKIELWPLPGKKLK